MPSSRSSCSMEPPGAGNPGVNGIGAGSGWPVALSVTVGELISVSGGWAGSAEGTNSTTVPVTATRLPTDASAGGALDVNTKIPSDVFGSPSPVASGSWMKKPLLLTPVTTPRVTTP